ncbi:sodium/solute symporter [Candidatus Sumerlaeota bacterium]|nr:sodium/solute symporter [Candidatus Sumerlaeota bacterium]
MLRFFYLMLSCILILSSSVVASAQDAPTSGPEDIVNYFKVDEFTSPPVQLSQAIIGELGEFLVIMGGYAQQDDQAAPNKNIYWWDEESKEWKIGGELDVHLSGGLTLQQSGNLICIGSELDGKTTNSILRIQWDNPANESELNASQRDILISGSGSIRIDGIAAIPSGIEGVSATAMNGALYLAGMRTDEDNGTSAPVFMSLSIADQDGEWTELKAWPGKARLNPIMAAHQKNIYLFGGVDPATRNFLDDAYVYDPGREWKQRKAAPCSIEGAQAVPCGDSHVLLIGMREHSQEILAYHVVTDTWVVNGHLPKPIALIQLLADGVKFKAFGKERIIAGEAELKATPYGWLDHSIVFIYIIGMLWIGAFLAKREKSSKDFFRGGQRVPWWASGLSLFATGASAISLMAMPAKSYAEDWIYFTVSIYSVMCLPLGLFVFAPIARRLNVATSNEYLERRFNLATRMYGSIIFILNQLLARMASIMLLPAIALSAIVGIPVWQSILIMGVVTTIYVTLGGLEAVIWTDVIQAIVMVGSVLLCITWAICLMHSGTTEMINALQINHKLYMFDWHLDLTRTCVYILFANVLVGSIGGLSDQNFIQRMQCTASEKDAVKAVGTQMAVAVPLNAVLFSLGTVLFLFYRERPELLSPALKNDGVYPLFAAQFLPSGIAGLVVAALLAATMSTLSSAVNSMANLGVDDWYRRLFKNATDHGCVWLGRILSVALGMIGTAAALWLAKNKMPSVWDLAILITGIIAPSIVAIFTLGVFSRRVNFFGIVCGAITSTAVTIYMKYYSTIDINAFLYFPAGLIVSVTVGYFASFLAPPPTEKQLKGLTAYTLMRMKRDEVVDYEQ